MEQYSLKNVKLPNGALVPVPESATQEQTMAYAKARGFMSEDEMMIYEDTKDMVEVADFYKKMDSVNLPQGQLGASAIFDVLVKPLAKFGYAGYKEPKTIARALPDVGSVAGTAAAGGVAVTAGLGTIPTALVLGIGSALGYFGGKQGEEAITGVEQATASQVGESIEAGAMETGMALLSPVVRSAVRGGKALMTKSLSLSSEFASEAEREFAENIANRLKQTEAGLLTTQAGTPKGAHGLLASVAYASAEGKDRMRAVLQGQSDFLDTNIDSLQSSFGERVSDQELGGMFVELVEQQKKLSDTAFKGLYADRLKGTANQSVSVAPIVGLAKNQIGKIKRSSDYVDSLIEKEDTISSLKEEMFGIRQAVIDASHGKDKEALQDLKLQLSQTKLDLDVAVADKDSFVKTQDIGMEESSVVSLYEEALKLQNKPDITIQELNDFNLNLKSKLRDIKSDNPAVANVKGFKGLTDMQTVIEKMVKSKLTTEQARDYDAINALYKNNTKVIRGNVVSSMMRKENTPTSIANLLTSSNNADYYTVIDDIAKTTKQTLLKSGAQPKQIQEFEKSVSGLQDSVKRKYLEENIRQYVTSGRDAFDSIGNFLEFRNKEAKTDVYDALFKTDSRLNTIDSLVKDYEFLIKNLPKGSGGRFSLAVLSQQSAGSRDVMQGGAKVVGGDLAGVATLVQGISKMFVPEALSWYVTNPKEAARLTKITRRAVQEAKQGRISVQVFTALSGAYNDMLNGLEGEQNADKIYKDVMTQMQQVN